MATAKAAEKSTNSAATKPKSGLKRLKPGEVLFNDGDTANSLYIIQKGQLRLYKPKGRGFIEIAVLRVGEVIGEMAYFAEDGTGQRRSCSASAMVSTEIIEISFVAFEKTMKGLNPWFKTIINTLASRLRKTNARVKELESNSAGMSYGTGKHADYEFFKGNDVIKVLGTLFLVFRTHGEKHEKGLSVHKKTLNLYAHDIFTIIEAKLDEMLLLLKELGYFYMENDEDGLPKVYVCKDVDILRGLFIFFNGERFQAEEKKIKIPDNCLDFLEKIYAKAKPPQDGHDKILVAIDKILEDYNYRNLHIGIEDLEPAKDAGITGEVIVGDDNALSVETNYTLMKKMIPILRFKSLLNSKNREKSGY